jgi:hypothetical protein
MERNPACMEKRKLAERKAGFSTADHDFSTLHQEMVHELRKTKLPNTKNTPPKRRCAFHIQLMTVPGL